MVNGPKNSGDRYACWMLCSSCFSVSARRVCPAQKTSSEISRTDSPQKASGRGPLAEGKHGDPPSVVILRAVRIVLDLNGHRSGGSIHRGVIVLQLALRDVRDLGVGRAPPSESIVHRRHVANRHSA
jgi:hypothetical protein